MHREERIRRLLDRLADKMIQRILHSHPSIEEGEVSTAGPPPYRRLDCDGRALAYIRSRPRKVAVRVDLSGLWVVPRGSHLQIPSASGAALLIRAHGDIDGAVAFLSDVLEATRSTDQNAA